jgi:polysaccharide pyruvyl transferase WcaK-like protein
MKALLLHGYSATNAGDGLLVEEGVQMLHDAFPEGIEVTVLALHPETFRDRTETVVDASFGRRGQSSALRAVLRRLGDFDLLVGVGGGYLRFGHPVEAAKTALAHLAQLRAVSRSSVPSVYLPQSIGPLRFGSRAVLRRLLAGVDLVHLRDDRSMAEVGLVNLRRSPDMALISGEWAERAADEPAEHVVLTARSVRGRTAPGVVELAKRLGDFDGYVQSTGAGNDDTRVVESLGPTRILTRQEYLDRGSRRVVVAVRLHAALMGLAAGHWVVHLAYERKGFGAFSDLGLSDHVFTVNHFDVDRVAALAERLRTDPVARADYDSRVLTARSRLADERTAIVADLRRRARGAR